MRNTCNFLHTGLGCSLSFLFCIILLCFPEQANSRITEANPPEANWGIAVTVRTASIAYDTIDDSVSSFVPMLFFDGEHFFLDGLGGGVKVWQGDTFRFDLFGRMRFVDIPEDFQNEIQADTIDLGTRLKYTPFEHFETDLEILSDDHSRMHGNLRVKYVYQQERLELTPYANLRYTSSDYNSYYYGLGMEDLGSGAELTLGLTTRYHMYRNLYAIGRVQTTILGDEAKDASFVNSDSVEEIYLGIGFFNEPEREKKPELSISPYLRIAHGWATPSNIGEIISGETESDPYNNQLTSIFYGYPLTDELFGFPLAVYLTPGFLWHWESDVQDSIEEFVVAIKAYYTFTWPIKWRFGAAEGVSYVSDIPFVEASEMERKGYEPSNLMNYLDFSIDVDLGDLFKSKTLANWYLGYSIHHRSAIFESAAQFGRISGGSNFNTVYLQYHF